ncbi:vegetative cell wall protein gp1-like, partial [Dioscorea cayenensis subsp. rotundata]|uniref:Vegetative cell wall protein gp1-like n=1 Tax=Dioscorea cayennensis subsp. rotundata TaxID=55577 RepID=A0AB40B1T0_DIOCR
PALGDTAPPSTAPPPTSRPAAARSPAPYRPALASPVTALRQQPVAPPPSAHLPAAANRPPPVTPGTCQSSARGFSPSRDHMSAPRTLAPLRPACASFTAAFATSARPARPRLDRPPAACSDQPQPRAARVGRRRYGLSVNVPLGPHAGARAASRLTSARVSLRARPAPLAITALALGPRSARVAVSGAAAPLDQQCVFP